MQKEISTSWNRENRNNMNDNFDYLFNGLQNNLSSFIKTGSITPEKTSFVVPSKNIFNPNNLVNGRVNGLGGITIDPDTNYKTTVYTHIEPNTTYYTNETIFIAEFDKDLSFVKYTFLQGNKTFKTQENTTFIRISTRNSDVSTIQVERGTVPTPYEEYYNTLKDVEFKQIHDAVKSDVKGKTFPSISERIGEVEQELIDLQPDDYEPVSDEVAIQVFVDEMNSKVTLLGGENPTFKNASGLFEPGQVTRADDLTLITRYGAGLPQLNAIWGTKSYNVKVKGANERVVPIVTSVTDDDFESDYLILGGKTGTLGVVKNLTIVAKHKSKGHVLAGTILKADDDRFDAMKSMFNECIKIIEGNPSANYSVEAEEGCAILLPENPTLYASTPLNELIYKKADIRQSPASVTKILSAIVAIENNPNLNDVITYKASDMKEDTIQFYEGDKVTVRDALYLMMLHSHNASAVALSRTIGQKIVRSRGYVQ